jgi:hypothetical protein
MGTEKISGGSDRRVSVTVTEMNPEMGKGEKRKQHTYAKKIST